MFKFSKMTEEEKQGFIHMHKVISAIMPGEAAQAMLHSLGKFLHDGVCTPQDAADVLLALYDEEKGEQIEQAMKDDPFLGLL